jgi:general secretion pathway protein K
MKRERGLAVVTALLIVAVAASAAALMLSQQSAMLDQVAMVSTRAQADAYALAGIDWARGVLAEDQRKGGVDSLDEGWAQPIAALPVERAVVSGLIVDEQGKFNLNNLKAPSGQDLLAFRTLLNSLGLPAEELLQAVQGWVGPEGAESAYYLSLPRPYRAANREFAQVDELYRVRGFDAATVAKLRPFVTALPGTQRAINVNTAPDAVLMAIGATAGQVADIKARRATKAFQQVSEFATMVPTLPQGTTGLDVKSSFFSVSVQVAQDDVRLATDALVQRSDTGPPVIIWRRPRY